MIRFAIALMFLSTPGIAAPAASAHRQPTPATVQQPTGDLTQPDSADATTQTLQNEQARIEARKAFMKRQESSDAKLKRTMGGICSGC